jgi:fluoroacetyl-CoA thioesterase
MAKAALALGLRHSRTVKIEPGLTVPEVSDSFGSFRDMPPVFATAYMIGFIEATCIEALAPFLAADQRTVGVHVDVSHIAATPVGMSVTASVELVEIKGRQLRFRIECRDEAEIIGAGHHARAIVDLPRFLAKVTEKAQQHSAAND